MTDYVKRPSVFTGLIIYLLSNYLHQVNPEKFRNIIKWVSKFFFPCILISNIVQGVFLDAWMGNYANTFVGGILVFTFPNFWFRFSFDSHGALGFTPRWEWPVLYSLWNALFVVSMGGHFLFRSYISALLILVISLFFVLLFKSWHLWAHARVMTLSCVILADSYFRPFFPNLYFTASKMQLIPWDIFNVLVACFVLYRTIKEKRHCLLRR